MARRPLRTSTELHQRLLWDPAFDATRVAVVVEDRFAGRVQVPLTEFVPGGAIPWSRVYAFVAGDLVLWDREARLDRVFGSGDTPPEAVVKGLNKRGRDWMEGGFFTPLEPLSFRGGRWRDARAQETQVPTRLRLLSWNLLFDLYDPAVVRLPERMPAILSLLERCDADLVALQEVTPAMWRTLLQQPWLRDRYQVSDGPDAGTLKPYGQALLSKLPMQRLGWHRYSETKRVLTAELALGERRLLVSTLHLTSDIRPTGAALREEQLDALLPRVQRPSDGAWQSLLMGDFNFGDDSACAQLTGWRDAWSDTRPGAPGVTYDTPGNHVARATNPKGRARRLDRVLLQAPDLRALGCRLLGTDPIPHSDPPLHPSDHYALETELAVLSDLLKAPPVYTTALVLLPPERLWPPIQAVRAEHDKSFKRWMPHINLLYGFLPEGALKAASELLSAALAHQPAFPVSLDEVKRFDHRGSSTAWLRPTTTPEGQLRALQQRLEALFPQCDEQGRKSELGFTPHLSIGQLRGRGRKQAQVTLGAPLQPHLPMDFVADRLQIIHRRGPDAPFEVVHSVRLGRGISAPRRGLAAAVAEQGWAALPPSPPAVDALRAQLAQLLEANVQVVGSRRLGVVGPDSDLDLVAWSPGLTRALAFEAAVQGLTPRHPTLSAQRVDHARAPLLKMTVDGLAVDLQVAELPELPSPGPGDGAAAWVDHLSSMDPASAGALLAVLDADLLKARLLRHGEAGLSTLSALRAWASARGLDSNAHGYPGGFAWALLCTWALERVPPGARQPHDLLQRTFTTLTDADLRAPIFLDGCPDQNPEPEHPARMCVLTPTAPVRNATRNLCRSTAQVLRMELARAATLSTRAQAGRAPWAALFEAPTPDPFALELTLSAPSAPALYALRDWTLARFTRALYALDHATQARLRPHPRWVAEHDTSGSWRIGSDRPLRGAVQAAESVLKALNQPEQGRPEGRVALTQVT